MNEEFIRGLKAAIDAIERSDIPSGWKARATHEIKRRIDVTPTHAPGCSIRAGGQCDCYFR